MAHGISSEWPACSAADTLAAGRGSAAHPPKSLPAPKCRRMPAANCGDASRNRDELSPTYFGCAINWLKPNSMNAGLRPSLIE
jgi:hypothetical protein